MDIVKIFNPTGECRAAISFMIGSKIMYQPYCEHRLKPSAGCRIKKGAKNPCKDCPAKNILPVTDDLIRGHMNGNQDLVGIYPLVGSRTPWVAADFDNHDGKHNPVKDVKQVEAMAANLDIPISVFKSRSGAGYHVYVFFSGMVPAVLARRLMNAILARAGVLEKSSFDAVFPKQDQLGPDDTGNLIALPWHGQSFEAGGSRFVHPDLDGSEPITENLDCFSEYFRSVTESELKALLESMGEATALATDFSVPGKPGTGKRVRSPGDLPPRLAAIVDKCQFIHHCRDHAATLSEPEWYSMICILATSYSGPATIHKFSQKYPKYSIQETNEKILHALNDQPGPIKCETVRALSPDVCNGCGAGVVCPVHLADVATPVDHQDLEWLNSALMGVVEGRRKATGKALCRYYMANGRDAGAVEEILTTWNARNIPPLPAEDLPQLIGESLNRRGMDAFSNAIGIIVSHVEHVIQADRTTYFLLYIEGQPWPVRLDGADFINTGGFKRKILELTRNLITVPGGKGSVAKWTGLVNNLLKEAEVIHKSEEESIIGTIRAEIIRMVKHSERNDEPNPATDAAFVYGGTVYLKLSQLKISVLHISELKKMKHDKLVELLGIIGFKYNNAAPRVLGHRIRAFTCDAHKFQLFQDNN